MQMLSFFSIAVKLKTAAVLNLCIIVIIYLNAIHLQIYNDIVFIIFDSIFVFKFIFIFFNIMIYVVAFIFSLTIRFCFILDIFYFFAFIFIYAVFKL